MTQLWWKQPTRVIQTNLQVRDTAMIEPRRLARQMKEMGANVLVFNVGGIYAWYPTKVPFHYQNEFLPQDRDLLAEVIEACHDEGIRFVARFDLSKADDGIYQQRPQWFVKNRSGEPHVTGSMRPGPWSLLMSTCINAPYRNEGVAIPVLDEVLSNYDIDGIFFNAPQYLECYCDFCRRKYRARYGRELPESADQFDPDWASSSLKDNMSLIYGFVKEKAPDLPMILYYFYKDDLHARAATSDIMCTEAQNVLSKGHTEAPEFWVPAANVKIGRTLPDKPPAYGIVHSSPGMDWRHTGLPPAEYLFWMSQVPAHGGQIWHSLTGIPDTITDKRILTSVTQINAMIAKYESYLHESTPHSQVALMWESETTSEDWADGLLNTQVPFDLLLEVQATAERLKPYSLVVVPDGFSLTPRFVRELIAFAGQGGRVVFEGPIDEDYPELCDLLGIERDTSASGEALTASYLRFEGTNNPLQRQLEETELVPHRGKVVYCTPLPGTDVLATLVPPFSPMESVGSPPERASLAVERTDLPLVCVSSCGKGKAVYLPFSLSGMISRYKLPDHYRLLANLIDMLLGEDRWLRVSSYPGLQVAAFRKEGQLLVNLVNGTGRRPLAVNVPLRGVQVELNLQAAEAKRVKGVRLLISEKPAPYTLEGGRLTVDVDELAIWESVLVELAGEQA